MEKHIQYDAVNNLYYATLLGGEFHNCDGVGKTAELAEISLRIRYNQLKRKCHNY
jgi:hypothetical protein